MEDEQKEEGFAQPCKTCGPTNWNPQQTRRELLKGAAVVGLGLTLGAGLLTTSPLPAEAATRLTIYICNRRLITCLDAAENVLEESACYIQREACLLLVAANTAGDIARNCAQWLANNAGAIVVLFIAGVAISFIVSTGGAGALILAPLGA